MMPSIEEVRDWSCNFFFLLFKHNFPTFIRIIKTNLFNIEIFRIKCTSDPFQRFFIFLMIRIIYNFQKIFISSDSPAILRRTCSFPSITYWIINVFIARKYLLQFYCMFPPITKIIFIISYPPLGLLRPGRNLPSSFMFRALSRQLSNQPIWQSLLASNSGTYGFRSSKGVLSTMSTSSI